MPYVIKTSSEGRKKSGITRFFAGKIDVPRASLSFAICTAVLPGSVQLIPIVLKRLNSFRDPDPKVSAGFWRLAKITHNINEARRYPWFTKFLAEKQAKSLVAKTEVVYDLPKPVKWLQNFLSSKPV